MERADAFFFHSLDSFCSQRHVYCMSFVCCLLLYLHTRSVKARQGCRGVVKAAADNGIVPAWCSVCAQFLRGLMNDLFC